MSDDLQPGADPEEHNSKPQESGLVGDVASAQEAFGQFPVAPVQEAFGQFSENPNEAKAPLTYQNPGFYNNPEVNAFPPNYGYAPNTYAVPPQGSYGQPPYRYQNAPVMQPPAPLPLWTAFRQLPRQYWHVLTNCNAATFMWEERKAAWNIIWVQLLLLGVFESVIAWLGWLLEFFLLNMLPGATQIEGNPLWFWVAEIAVLPGVIAGFFFGASLLYWLAKAFGGKGTFLSHCYSYALIVLPMSGLIALFAFIPCLNLLVELAGITFEVVLLIFMVKGVHRLSGGRASATVLIPVATGVVLIIGLYFAYLSWAFSNIRHY